MIRMTKDCNLCNALKNEKDKFLYEDDDIVILPTKKMKGHKKRIMVVTKEHIGQFSLSYDTKVNEERYTQQFIWFCREYFDEPTFCLNEPTYATMPEHWHLVASDWWGEDLMQICYTPHKAVSTRIKWLPEGEDCCEGCGCIIDKGLIHCSACRNKYQ